MHIFSEYKQLILSAAQQSFPALDYSISFTVEAPKDVSHGDIASNIALIAAKQLSMQPKQIAEMIVAKLIETQKVEKAWVAGPGFINIQLHNKVWYRYLENIIQSKAQYENSDIGHGESINLEFVSCNPTGPMHIGHSRGAIFGDCLARILERVGYKVTREFYINDAGTQIKTLVKSAHIRYLQALGVVVELPEDCYPGDYLIPVASILIEHFGESLKLIPETEVYSKIKELVVNCMMDQIKSDLAALGVEHEVFSSEQKLHDNDIPKQALSLLKSKNLVFEGTLEPPKGKVIEDWEAKNQTIFKSTDFGDDVDRPLIKSNGQYTYFAGDVAYHYNKIERGFKNMILVLGADHAGYIKRISSAVAALSNDQATIKIQVTQMVNLLKNGEPYKMSKRAGNFITVHDMIEEVGVDILRFIMLTRKADTVLDLDFTLAKQESKDNPVFYVQYAHARACSVARKSAEANLDVSDARLDKLSSPEELLLIKKIASWPKLLESSAEMYEPHRITYYLYELATQFHSLWSLGTSNESMRFIIEDDLEISKARISLALAVQYTIASALDCIGVKALERM